MGAARPSRWGVATLAAFTAAVAAALAAATALAEREAVNPGLGPAPAGYGYVRGAGDILLMSLGTRVVIDAVLW